MAGNPRVRKLRQTRGRYELRPIPRVLHAVHEQLPEMPVLPRYRRARFRVLRAVWNDARSYAMHEARVPVRQLRRQANEPLRTDVQGRWQAVPNANSRQGHHIRAGTAIRPVAAAAAAATTIRQYATKFCPWAADDHRGDRALVGGPTCRGAADLLDPDAPAATVWRTRAFHGGLLRATTTAAATVTVWCRSAPSSGIPRRRAVASAAAVYASRLPVRQS
jgi:hypothetical protein